MPVPKIPDAEFVELWKTHKSGRKIAESLGIDERAVFRRRRRLEDKYHFPIEAKPGNGHDYTSLQPKEHSAWHKLEVKDGVVIVFSDAHYWPGPATPAHRALLMVIEALQPKAVICNGDALDGASISRYPRIGWDSTPSILEELNACTIRLGEIESVAGKAKLVWTLGNHCARYEVRLANTVPQYQGVKGFNLKDHFPKWAPCWATEINGNTVVKHKYKSGAHAAYRNTVTAGKNIITGHLHSLKVTPYTDYVSTRYGVDTGTLADPQGPQFENYLECNPTDWRSGFAVLTFHKGELLMPELVSIMKDGRAQFRGSVFKV